MVGFQGVQIPEKPLGGNPLGSLIEGIKTGHDYAKAKALIQYRQQEIERQKVQAESARQLHQAQVGRLLLDTVGKVAGAQDSKSRQMYYSFLKSQNETLGRPLNLDKDWDAMVKNDGFMKNLADQMYRLKTSKDPRSYSQAAAWLLTEGRSAGQDFYKGVQAEKLAGVRNENTNQRYDTTRGDRLDQKKKDALDKYSTALNKDKIYQTARVQADDAQKLRQVIEEAKINPVDYAQIPAMIARAVTGTSRIPLAELKASGGSKAVLDKAQQAAQEFRTGTLSQKNYQFFSSFVDTLENHAEQTKLNVATDYAKVFTKHHGGDVKENYENLTGSPFPFNDEVKTEDQGSPTEPSSTKESKISAPKIKIPKEHEDHIRAQIEMMRGKKIDDQTIGKALQKAVPNLDDGSLQYFLSPPSQAPKEEEAPAPSIDLEPVEAPKPDMEEGE